jgi:uncharacterized protein (TIGR03435 family)
MLKRLGVYPLVFAAVAYGQRPIPKNNRYEVVSIRPGIRGARHGYHPSAGEIRLDNISVQDLIGSALLIANERMIGLPAWASSETFSLRARSVAPANPGEQWAMWVPVLEDRFKLKYHREKRQAPVYELSLLASGIRFLEAVPGSCKPIDPNDPPRVEANARKPGDLRPPGNCGMVLARQLPGGGVQLSVRSFTMANLAAVLAHYVDRPVVDRTGTARLYDVLMSFDNQAPGFSDISSDLPTIYDALKRAGLQLTRANGAVEVMVIDRLERPSEN